MLSKEIVPVEASVKKTLDSQSRSKLSMKVGSFCLKTLIANKMSQRTKGLSGFRTCSKDHRMLDFQLETVSLSKV